MLLGSGAAAMDCVFDQECITGEACSESAFEVSVSTNPAEQTALLSTIFGDYVGLYSNVKGQAPHSVMSFNASTGDSLHLTFSDEQAWLTFHMPSAEMAITYLGSCTP